MAVDTPFAVRRASAAGAQKSIFIIGVRDTGDPTAEETEIMRVEFNAARYNDMPAGAKTALGGKTITELLAVTDYETKTDL